MPSLTISPSFLSMCQELKLWQDRATANETINLIFPSGHFMRPAALAALASWALSMQTRGRSFQIMGNSNTVDYVNRMNLHEIIKTHSPRIAHNLEAGRFIPLSLTDSSEAQKRCVDKLCDLILRQFENGRQLLPAFEWAANEITDNVLIHSQTRTPGIVTAQYYPKVHQLEIAIVDQGIGLLGTLGPTHGAQHNREAIELALTRGLTRSASVGQGNGLAGTELIVRTNGGSMDLWTGDARMIIRKGAVQYETIPPISGVGIALLFDVRNPINLSMTWLGEKPFTYLDVQIEKLEKRGFRIFIRHECESVGGREPARRLRNKIMSLLPGLQGEQVIFDFSEVRDPSSSFLDELFGRMALELGQDDFMQRIKINALSIAAADRANVVIHQRLNTD